MVKTFGYKSLPKLYMGLSPTVRQCEYSENTGPIRSYQQRQAAANIIEWRPAECGTVDGGVRRPEQEMENPEHFDVGFY